MMVFLAISGLIIIFILILKFSTKEVGSSKAVIKDIHSSCRWSGIESFQVEMYCKEHNLTQTFSVPKDFIMSVNKGDELEVTITATLNRLKTMSIDFEKLNSISNN